MKSCMRAFITAVLLGAVSLPIFAFPAEGVSVTVLPSGLKVIVREGHAVNLAAVDVWVRAGSVNETEESNGVSHFVEHMIFKATRKYGPGQIDREIEGLGAELNGGTSKDWVHFYTTVASEYLPTALEVLSDAIINAQFRPEDVEKERRVILDEIARADSDPLHRAFDLFCEAAFTAHPYRLPPTGAREAISKLTRDDLAAYYNQHYTPANTCVVIAGDVARSDALALVQRAFSGFVRTAREAEVPAAEPPLTTARVRRFPSQTNRSFVVLGYHVAPASDLKEICALDVILAILGDTYRGRIPAALNAKDIRFEKVVTDFIIQRHPTTFSVLVSVDPRNAEDIAPVLLSEFRKLREDPVSAGELAHARRLVEGGDLFEQETFSGQARALGLYESIASYDLALKYGGTVRDVSSADITAVARKYFAGDNYCLALIEPQQAQE